jgi:regulator of protease activity HflC (stomatin/prohibitin superfamily)
MAFESVPEIMIGVAVEVAIFALFAGVIYRFFSGRFLIPKREIVLPNQRGVLVERERIIRVAEPGVCWVRPKQRIILCDMRSRPLQLAGIEVVSSDNGIVRVTLVAEYRIVDAAIYYTRSANANDALFLQVRRALVEAARCQASASLTAGPRAFAATIGQEATPDVAKLGFEIVDLQIVEAISLGWVRQSAADPLHAHYPPDTLVH